MLEWLTSPFLLSTLCSRVAMNDYELNYTVPSPGNSIAFMEFSPNGRFLAVGDQGRCSLYILDRLAGFHPTISAATPAKPAALVWETTTAFYVGLGDGRFIHYQIGLGENKLVKGTVNNFFYGVFPVTAIAIDVESKTLVLSVGPDVFAFRRIRETDEFRFAANVSSRFNFERDPGNAPPFPRSICFTPNNTLVITFCRRNIASIVLEFDGDSRLHSSFQTARIDYSSLPIFKTITSASGEGIHQLTRFWVYDNVSQTDCDGFPFLLINGGGATLSGSMFGAAIVRDTITRREIQLLEHTEIAGRHLSIMAYHVSNNKYSIATVDCGANATVKIWTARRPPSHPQGRLRHGFRVRKGWVVAVLVIAFFFAVLSKVERLPDISEIPQFGVQDILAFTKVRIRIGYLILDTTEYEVLGAEDVLD